MFQVMYDWGDLCKRHRDVPGMHYRQPHPCNTAQDAGALFPGASGWHRQSWTRGPPMEKKTRIFACIRYFYTWNKKGALKHNTPDSFPKEIHFPNIIESIIRTLFIFRQFCTEQTNIIFLCYVG